MSTPALQRTTSILAGVYFISAVMLGVFQSSLVVHLPPYIAIYAAAITIMSPISFAAYAMDKRAAVKGTLRTRERTLHIIDLLGGWPGGVFAQQMLRHKSYKRSYRFILALTILLHLALAGWLVYVVFHTGKPT